MLIMLVMVNVVMLVMLDMLDMPLGFGPSGDWHAIIYKYVNLTTSTTFKFKFNCLPIRRYPNLFVNGCAPSGSASAGRFFP